jgi:uncharacterized protein (TIGR02996 family)
MSREEDALIAAVCADPDDDAPRLVYADWLDDHDQPERAELIRVELEIERLPVDDPGRRPLVWRARELLYHHQNDFSARLPRAVQHFTPFFRRGFVARIYGTATRFIKDGAAIVRSVPVEQADLFNIEGRIADLAATPALAHLRRLRFDRTEDPDTINLLDSPHLTRLTHLDLDCAALYAPGARRLAKKKRLAQLTSLRPGRLDGPGLRALLRSPHLANLTSLDLQNNDIGPGGIDALTEAKQLDRLTCLSLDYAGPTLRGIERLAAWPRMEHLTSLNLGSCFFGDEGLRLLARASSVPRLRVLDLSNNRLTPACVEELLSWPGLDALTNLDLSSNDIGADALKTLLSSPRLARLTRLSTLSIGDPRKVARVVAKARGLNRLHTLDAEFGLTDTDPERIALHKRFSPWAFYGELWPF